MRGLLLVALSGLFAATSALATPALTAPAGIKPAGTPTAEIATLDTLSVEFKWNRGNLGAGQVRDFTISVGSLIGSNEIAASAVIPAVDGDPITTDYAVTLPVMDNGGNRMFVRLSYNEIVDGVDVLKHVDYVINGAISPLVDGDVHFVYSPVPGSALSLLDVDGCKAPPMVEFDWALARERVIADGDKEPTNWWFYLGTAGDTDQYFNSGIITPEQRSVTIANVPTTGEALIATLWWRIADDGAWSSSTFGYSTPTLPAISSPTANGTLSGTAGNLELSPNGLPVAFWWVYAGPERQSVSYLSQGKAVADPTTPTTTLQSFTNFPDDGSKVFVTLFWRLQGETAQQWKCREYVYNASTGPAITVPAADAELPIVLSDPDDADNSETVEWDNKGTEAVRWEVVLNSTGDPNDNGTWSSGQLAGTVRTTEIPKGEFTTDGGTVYIVLRYAVNGGLAEEFFDGSVVAAYKTKKAPFLTAPGSIAKCFTAFRGNEAEFSWTDGNFADVEGYWLYVGDARGGDNFLNTGALGVDVTSRSVNNLPTDGSALWVRLWYLVETSTTGTSDNDPGDTTTGGTTTTTNQYAFRDFKFTNPNCPEITAPGLGATIDGLDHPVTINTRGEAVNSLWVTASSEAPSGGDAKNPDPGDADIDSSGLLPASATSFLVRDLPVNGSTVYVTLWWLKTADPGVNVGWDFRTYAFVSSNATQPALVSPDATEELTTNAGLNFTWNTGETVVSGWWLYVGSDVGLSDRHNSGFLAPGDLSDAVGGLPFGDSHVRLWYLDQLGTWQSIDYVLNNTSGGSTGGGGDPTGPTGPTGETDSNGDNNGL